MPVSQSANGLVVRRFYDDMWNRFNIAVLDEIAAPDIRFRGSLGDTTQGRDGLAAYVRKIQGAFPDFHNEVLDLLSVGDVVMARLRYTGTHLGPLGTAAPTGRVVRYDGLARFTVQSELIADAWVLGDLVTLNKQLSIEPR
jgi:predicted ester cyclase